MTNFLKNTGTKSVLRTYIQDSFDKLRKQDIIEKKDSLEIVEATLRDDLHELGLLKVIQGDSRGYENYLNNFSHYTNATIFRDAINNSAIMTKLRMGAK